MLGIAPGQEVAWGCYTAAIVCVKLYQLQYSLARLSSRITNTCMVVLPQNGIVAPWLAAQYFKAVVVAQAYFNVIAPSPFMAAISLDGRVELAPFTGTAEADLAKLREDLISIGWEVEMFPRAEQVQIPKLLLAITGPIFVLEDVCPSVGLGNPGEVNDILREVLLEGFQVLSTWSQDFGPNSAMERAEEMLENLLTGRMDLKRKSPGVSIRPSIYSDLKRKTGMTEVPDINGFIVRAARLSGTKARLSGILEEWVDYGATNRILPEDLTKMWKSRNPIHGGSK